MKRISIFTKIKLKSLSKLLTKTTLLFITGIVVCPSTAYSTARKAETLSLDVQAGLHSSVINPVQPHLVFDNKEEAAVWLHDMSIRLKKWIPDQFLRERYLTSIQYEASRAGLDPQLVLAVITIESRFSKYAMSGVGARGLMQVMPFWKAQIGTPDQNLFDIQTNIRYGCTILRYYLQREHGNLDRALAAYNGSLGQNWYPKLVMNAYKNYWMLYPIVTLKNNELTYISSLSHK